ncbi:hypothetical protein L873DRAFT_1800398 [Choiromyces venosus 120613-1]|uniref:Ubiquitin 3 binding protein But2 C-terminal domain-containing protein n=1 Tax=Choiromyces venosus 120613-1 TaxID=1336337 RepID=A0A3N4K2X3_9PEZI|nr:hypothetical protein L873DRAFT_1800398 [Choiromyces venosus 120613-1]
MFPKILHPFTTLLLLAFTILTTSTPVPDISAEDLAELAVINQRTIPVNLPVYTLSEDGKTFTMHPNETMAAGDLLCETSSGSPYVWDIERAVFPLSFSNDLCTQTNPGGSKCTSHSRIATAALSVCGTWMVSVKCNGLAWVGNMVKDNCRWKDQAGGTWFYDNGSFGKLKGIVHWNN